MRPRIFNFRHGREQSEHDGTLLHPMGSYLEAPEHDIEERMDGHQSGVSQIQSGATGSGSDNVEHPGHTTNKSAPRITHIGADRPIFTLSVAADLLGLHPRTLRIYEEKRLVVPARTEGNRRRYSQNDIQRFQFIRRLTQGGVNLEGVRIILDMAAELSSRGGDSEAIIERNLHFLDAL